MTRILTISAAAALALASSVALGSPQIPTPANPYPDEPVATDGSPLGQHFRSVRKPDGFNALFDDRKTWVAPR